MSFQRHRIILPIVVSIMIILIAFAALEIFFFSNRNNDVSVQNQNGVPLAVINVGTTSFSGSTMSSFITGTVSVSMTSTTSTSMPTYTFPTAEATLNGPVNSYTVTEFYNVLFSIFSQPNPVYPYRTFEIDLIHVGTCPTCVDETLISIHGIIGVNGYYEGSFSFQPNELVDTYAVRVVELDTSPSKLIAVIAINAPAFNIDTSVIPGNYSDPHNPFLAKRFWNPTKTTLTFKLPKWNTLQVRNAIMTWWIKSVSFENTYEQNYQGSHDDLYRYLTPFFTVDGINSTGTEDVDFRQEIISNWYLQAQTLFTVDNQERFIHATVRIQFNPLGTGWGGWSNFTDVMTHEVGHVLGLGHDFRAGHEIDVMSYSNQEKCITTWDIWGLLLKMNYLHRTPGNNPPITMANIYGDFYAPDLPYACIP